MKNIHTINSSSCSRGNSGFAGSVLAATGGPVTANSIEALQVNMGYRCNLACKHCHVEGGPANSFEMAPETCAAVLDALESPGIKTLDITGGAPELNPGFREMATMARSLGKHVIVRSNLAIFFEPGHEGLPGFFADNRLEVIASLPCYTKANVDGIRGPGVFDKSIKAIKMLNSLGYGEGGGLALNLVYNPAGAFLPGSEQSLQKDYKRALAAIGVGFDNLYAFTNMPVGRFRRALEASGELVAYEQVLKEAFNPATLDGIMCRGSLSVAPDGRLHDCDFNQAALLPLQEGLPQYVKDFDYDILARRTISVCEHCFGCTAGSGST